MTSQRSPEYLAGLVRELAKLPHETEWIEFKMNRAEPEEIGKYISALSNSAALLGKMCGYCVWGVEDDGHRLAGTTFRPATTKQGNEPLENWILRLLEPKIEFRFFEVTVDGVRIVLLEISRASRHPVKFQGQEFIRVGSQKKKLKDFPEKERTLWRIFDQIPFEEVIAAEHVSSEQTLKLLEYPSYFEMLKIPLPESREGILEALKDDKLIRPCDAGGWNITNLGAILFARKLEDFARLGRKALRVIRYQGNSRIETIREQVSNKGYACGFEDAIRLVMGMSPSHEVIEKGIRRDAPMYPEPAIRELIPNALIHQDFFVTGAGPMVEIFDSRIEVTNPGAALVSTDRFLDSPPTSRNDGLASFMRRVGICEERGTGVDKIVIQTELHQLPAPIFQTPGDFTRAFLHAPRPLAKMEKDERIRACYMHACLRYVNGAHLTNQSVRERFGISKNKVHIASRLIREAVTEGAILPHKPDAGTRYMEYVPSWAAADFSLQSKSPKTEKKG